MLAAGVLKVEYINFCVLFKSSYLVKLQMCGLKITVLILSASM